MLSSYGLKLSRRQACMLPSRHFTYGLKRSHRKRAYGQPSRHFIYGLRAPSARK